MKKLLVALVTLVAALAAHTAWSAGDAAPPSLPPLSGEVLEVQDAGSFTYLRLKTAKGETWAAVSRAAVKKGDKVTLENPTVMQNFESRSLKRTFDVVVFGTLAGAGAGSASPSAAGGVPASAAPRDAIHGSVARSPDVGAVKVARAEGPDARTVAEVNADRLALKGKTVAVRAKVVKVTAGVMGKNWIHLRDGTGKAADGTDDLVVTSKDLPQPGDVVVARGLVKADVDLGAGYAYKVLVEDASIRK